MTKTKKKNIRKIIRFVIVTFLLTITIENFTLNITKIAYSINVRAMGTRNEIVVDSDLNAKLYISDSNGDFPSVPNEEWKIDEESWDAMVTSIKKYGFIYLPDDIDSGLVFGGLETIYGIEIETNRGVYYKGGAYNAGELLGGNYQFCKIIDVVSDNVYIK